MDSKLKIALRKVCSPLLTPLEAGEENYSTRPSHRIVLNVIGILFSLLATIVCIVSPKENLSFLIPAIVFYGTGVTALIVGLLGTDRAVAKIWGSK